MGKAIIVTGATRGLGRAVSIKLAQRGQTVYAIGRTKPDLISLSKESPLILTLCADIHSASDRKKIIDSVQNDNAQVSIIHNASVAEPNLFEALPEGDLEKHIGINCVSSLLLTRSLMPFFYSGSRILNITSGAATMALPGLLPYCISKAAMHQAIRCMGVEFNGKIYCANLGPGLLDTSMIDRWRLSDEKKLPGQSYYSHMKRTKQLICPELAAEFVTWVLLETTDNLYQATHWQIYDEKYHAFWLPVDAKKPVPPSM